MDQNIAQAINVKVTRAQDLFNRMYTSVENMETKKQINFILNEIRQLSSQE